MNSDVRWRPKHLRNELPRTSDDLEGRDPKTVKKLAWREEYPNSA